ncbi:MAG: peptide chain release factor N(5)-glutamine methyltransferase [Bacilli bacterium]
MNLQQFWQKHKKTAENLNKELTAVRFLICELLSISVTDFYAFNELILSQEQQTMLEQAINRYFYDNEPVQYIVGHTYFWGLKIYVSPNVLIPRPETEELVETIIKHNPLASPTIIDIGTGSGAIALALKKHIPKAVVYATDISQAAILVARQNAQALGLAINFIEGDLFASIPSKVDIIVSNPPYIDKKETVDVLVKDNEPHLALFANNNGLSFYDAILKQALCHLHNDYLIAMEIPINHDEELLAMAELFFPKAKKEIKKDLSNRSRILLIQSK